MNTIDLVRDIVAVHPGNRKGVYHVYREEFDVLTEDQQDVVGDHIGEWTRGYMSESGEFALVTDTQ